MTVKALLEKFPRTEEAARGIKDSDWRKSVFTTHQEGNRTIFLVPKNLESYSDNLLMIALLQAVSLLGYTIQPSETEVPTAVLKTTDGEYFCGYVAQAMKEFTGPREKRTSKFYRGVLSFQCSSLRKAVGDRRMHLFDVEHTPGRKLAEMSGFTKDYWGLRGSISSIFSALTPNKWNEEATYLLPKEILEQKVVRRKLPFDNGGVYTPEEILYFKDYFAKEVKQVENFHASLAVPTNTLAREFWNLYDPVQTALKGISAAIGNVYISRARIAFPVNKGKKNIAFLKLSLREKLRSEISEDNLEEWSPNQLPGWNKVIKKEYADKHDLSLIRQKYGLLPEMDDLRFAVAERYESIWAERLID